MSMISNVGESILGGGMMLQPSKTEPPRNGAFPPTTPISQFGTQAHIDQASRSSMLPLAPSVRDIQSSSSVDIYA